MTVRSNLSAGDNLIYESGSYIETGSVSDTLAMEKYQFLALGVEFTKGSLSSCTIRAHGLQHVGGSFQRIASGTGSDNWELVLSADFDGCVHIADTSTTDFLPMPIPWEIVRLRVTTLGVPTGSSLKLFAAVQ